MRIAFLGSPPFAVRCCEHLLSSPFKPVLLVTQPDRPSGRGRKVRINPLAELAQREGIPRIACENAAQEEFLEELRSYRLDWIVVVAFGQILKKSFLELPAGGCLNVHASLLPRYRGAAPIAAAIRNGDARTGITIQRIALRLDAGEILLRRALAIPPRATAGDLAFALAEIAGPVLCEALELIAAGRAVFTPQDESLVSFAPKLSREDGWIDWSSPALEIERQVRSLAPRPGAWTTLPVRARPLECRIIAGENGVGSEPGSRPGTVLRADEDGIAIAAGDGNHYRVLRLQGAGSKALAAGDFLRGRPLAPGGLAGAPGGARPAR